MHQIISSLPLLFELMDKGGFYIACAMGRHRTDIAIALYYVMHPSVPFEEVPGDERASLCGEKGVPL